jgi:NO-binding membrane sensor protein with MHYT domain
MNFLSNWFQQGLIPHDTIAVSYIPGWAVISYIVSVLAAYVAFDMVMHFRSEGRTGLKYLWLSLGAFSIGAGVWAMHFTAMIAFNTPLPITYDAYWIFSSLVIAILASGLAFALLKATKPSFLCIGLSSILMGLGIVAMHYMGMTGIVGNLDIHYKPGMFFLSVFVAILASGIALWLLLHCEKGSFSQQFRFKLASAFIMGAAICLMHTIGMDASIFTLATAAPTQVVDISTQTLNLYITTVIVIVIILILVVSSDRHATLNAFKIEQAEKYKENLISNTIVLEQRVVERTNELDQQNKKLTSALDQLKSTQDILMHAGQMAVVGQLTGGIAHEINNPLSYIISNINLLQKKIAIINQLLSLQLAASQSYKNSGLNAVEANLAELTGFIEKNNIDELIAELNEMITESQEGLDKINKIITNLRTVTIGKELSYSNIDINTCIESALDVAWNKIKNKCQLEKRLDQLPLIKGNAHQLISVLIGLILNAAEAINNKGQLTIISCLENSNIVVKVIDTGCGISPENMSKLFTPFFSTKAIGKFSGLSLSTAYNIIKQHGGTIVAESKVGQGTAFTIYFPISDMDPGK